MRIQDRQSEGEGEEDPGQPAGKLDQHIGGLRAENIFGHATAKGRAQPFALWTLHQNDQQHQKRDQNVNREQEVNQDLHRGRAIWLNATWKQTSNAQRPTPNVECKLYISAIGRSELSVGRLLFDLIPDFIQLRQIDIAQFLAARAQFIFQ